MSQKSTNAETAPALSPVQLAAIQHLLAGETVTASAQAAGVSRETVHRWRKEDWLFQAEFNRRQREIQSAIQSRLLSMALAATDTVNQAIAGGDLKAALAVLKGVAGLDEARMQLGSDDPKFLKEEAELAAKERAGSMMLRSLSAL
jgi:hypothetical protein